MGLRMAENENTGKIDRCLEIYARLSAGEIIRKADLTSRFGVNERSIDRDIESVRHFLEERFVSTGEQMEIVYDRPLKGYRLETKKSNALSRSEILAVCKILLESRAFSKKRMHGILQKLVNTCTPSESKALVLDLILNEEFHYIEPRHKSDFLNQLWDLGIAIKEHRYIEVDYLRLKDRKVVKRKLQPVAILFSEYYFYLTAFIEDKEVRKDFDVIEDSFPTIYRIDRIRKFKTLEEQFYTPYKNRFQEGEFRKRVQFMYGGKLRRIKFVYSGLDVDAVLDRLPTAEILQQKGNEYIIKAEVFGDGIDMWLRSQGNNIKPIEYL